MSSLVNLARRAGFIVPIISLVLVASLFTGAQAAPVDWDNDSGANARFGWSDGQSGDGDLGGDGLWGNPIVNELGFFFRDMDEAFMAEATYPSADNILSSTSVLINTNNSDPAGAAPLTELHIREWGSYTGDIENVSSTFGTVLLVPIIPGGVPVNVGELTMTYDDVEKTWEASMDIYFDEIGGMPPFPAEVQLLSLDVTNHLKAVPVDGSASIQKLGADIIVPEPACLTLLLFGLGGMLLRRR